MEYFTLTLKGDKVPGFEANTLSELHQQVAKYYYDNDMSACVDIEEIQFYADDLGDYLTVLKPYDLSEARINGLIMQMYSATESYSERARSITPKVL